MIFITAQARELPKGTSAWAYSADRRELDQVRKFNSQVPSARKFRYFFPYAGSVDFNASEQTAQIYYDSRKTSRYSRRLPKRTLVFPIVDALAPNGRFSGWTDANYSAVADQVAQAIIDDPHAAGTQIDVEPFSEDHLPFYRHLKAKLNAAGKFSTLFVGAKSEELMVEIFAACDVVVISGYDLNKENPGAEEYRTLLARAVARTQKAAVRSGGRYMVGIPASASWGEYEAIVDRGGRDRVESGTTQEEYVRAALGVLSRFSAHREFLGVALWRMSGNTTEEHLETVTKPTKLPDAIRPSVWKLLEDDWASQPAN